MHSRTPRQRATCSSSRRSAARSSRAVASSATSRSRWWPASSSRPAPSEARWRPTRPSSTSRSSRSGSAAGTAAPPAECPSGGARANARDRPRRGLEERPEIEGAERDQAADRAIRDRVREPDAPEPAAPVEPRVQERAGRERDPPLPGLVAQGEPGGGDEEGPRLRASDRPGRERPPLRPHLGRAVQEAPHEELLDERRDGDESHEAERDPRRAPAGPERVRIEARATRQARREQVRSEPERGDREPERHVVPDLAPARPGPQLGEGAASPREAHQERRHEHAQREERRRESLRKPAAELRAGEQRRVGREVRPGTLHRRAVGSAAGSGSPARAPARRRYPGRERPGEELYGGDPGFPSGTGPAAGGP